MRFGGNGAHAHCARGKPLHDFLGGFHRVQRNRPDAVAPEVQQPPQRHLPPALVIDDVGVLAIGSVVFLPGRLLQLHDGFGRPHMFFPFRPPGVLAAHGKFAAQLGIDTVGRLMFAHGFLHDFEKSDAFHTGRCAVEIAIHKITLQTDGFKNTGTPVTHQGGDAHFGHNFREALPQGRHVICNGFLSALPP